MAVKSLVFLNVLIYIGFLSTLVYILYSNIVVKSVATKFEMESQDEWTIIVTTSPKLSNTTPVSLKEIVPENITEVKTYGELSTWLCLKEQNRPENSLKPELKDQPCPDKGIVTVHPGGRTGEFFFGFVCPTLEFLTILR